MKEVGCKKMREVPEEEFPAMNEEVPTIDDEAPDGSVPAVDEESPDSGFLALGEETPDNSDPEVEIENGVTQEMPTLPDGYYELDAIRKKRIKKGRAEYFVKWYGWPESENTWEPYEHLEGVSWVVEAFEQSLHSAKGRRGRKQKSWQKRRTPTFVVTNDASSIPDNGNSGQDNDMQEPDQTINEVNVGSIDVQMQGVGEADVNGRASEDLAQAGPSNASRGLHVTDQDDPAIVRIIRLVSTEVPLNPDDEVLMTFAVRRSDGKEAMTDNKFLKMHCPHLLIAFYERCMTYTVDNEASRLHTTDQEASPDTREKEASPKTADKELK